MRNFARPATLTLLPLLTLAAPITGLRADPAPKDLGIEVAGSAWHHASGKPLDLATDPAGKHPGQVAKIPPDLAVFFLDGAAASGPNDAVLTSDVLLEGGDFHGGLVTTEKGPHQGQGYFYSLDPQGNLSIGWRGGFTGPWEWISSSKVALPEGWNKFKFEVENDGTIQLYLNGDLMLEKQDTRLPLHFDQVSFQSNGSGQKYVAAVTLANE